MASSFGGPVSQFVIFLITTYTNSLTQPSPYQYNRLRQQLRHLRAILRLGAAPERLTDILGRIPTDLPPLLRVYLLRPRL